MISPFPLSRLRTALVLIVLAHVLGVSLALSQVLIGEVAYAAPLPPQPYQPPVLCKEGAFKQDDIAGVYEQYYMRVDVQPCGGVVVHWFNEYGDHYSLYYSEARVPGGGVYIGGYMPDPEINAYLDSTPLAAITPMEPGYIRFTTASRDGQTFRSYRLMKTA
jgi:hypothetical protein